MSEIKDYINTCHVTKRLCSVSSRRTRTYTTEHCRRYGDTVIIDSYFIIIVFHRHSLSTLRCLMQHVVCFQLVPLRREFIDHVLMQLLNILTILVKLFHVLKL